MRLETVFFMTFFKKTLKLLFLLKFPLYKRSHRRCSTEKDVLKNFSEFRGKRLCRSLLLTKMQTCNFIKNGTPTQEFSCEFSKKFLNTFFTEQIQAIAFSEPFWVLVDIRERNAIYIFI